MIGNLFLGAYSIGTNGSSTIDNTCSTIIVKGLDTAINIKIVSRFITSDIDIQSNDVELMTKINILPIVENINVESYEVKRKIVNKTRPNTAFIKIIGYPVTSSIIKSTPSTKQYIDYLKTNIRTPIYKIEFLRKQDESVLNTVEGEIINNSGSVTNTLNEGVRRTCNFSLENYNEKYTKFIDNISIGNKFKLYLGYKINGINKYFSQGVFVIDDPSITSMLSQRDIQLTGTDKWSMLNGQNGGVLDGTYVVKKGTKIGDLIRKTLRLDIVNDPIEPSIDKDIADSEITYDITKNAGETISDILLEVAFNISAYIYYDENGRLQIHSVDDDVFKASSYTFSKNEYNYLGATRIYQLNKIYNSILVIGENIKDTNTPIIYEAKNNDLSDVNSIPNVGFKKTKKITEYTKGIDTIEKAQARANWELKKAKAKNSNIDITCLSLYHLDVNQIVTLNDATLNSNGERFIINSIDLPIGVDIQSTINLTKVV